MNLPLILYQFYKVTILDTITNSRFTSWLPRCALFYSASFWRQQSVFGITDRTPEPLMSHKKCILWIAFFYCLFFVTGCFYLCGVNFWWRFAALWEKCKAPEGILCGWHVVRIQLLTNRFSPSILVRVRIPCCSSWSRTASRKEDPATRGRRALHDHSLHRFTQTAG